MVLRHNYSTKIERGITPENWVRHEAQISKEFRVFLEGSVA